MKKSTYREACEARRRGETPKGGWGRVFKFYGAGSKLARKAREGKL